LTESILAGFVASRERGGASHAHAYAVRPIRVATKKFRTGKRGAEPLRGHQEQFSGVSRRSAAAPQARAKQRQLMMRAVRMVFLLAGNLLLLVVNPVNVQARVFAASPLYAVFC
jgi:hypothetical protein